MNANKNGDVRTHPAFSVLTQSRLETFCRAILNANLAYTQFAIQQPEAYKDMDNMDLASLLRSFIKASLKQALGDDINIRVRKDNGVFLIAIDQNVLIHLKKLNKRTLIGSIPRTLQRAKSEPRNEILPGFEDVLDDDIPLSDFEHHLIAGYVTDLSGTVGEFYFNVQEGPVLLDQLPLDLSNPVVQIRVNEIEQSSETTFTLKSTDGDIIQEGAVLSDQRELDLSVPTEWTQANEIEQPGETTSTLKDTDIDTDQEAFGN